jgi:enoyl-CoA hydratase
MNAADSGSPTSNDLDGARNADDAVIVEMLGHIAVITINRPAARNAVNAAVATGIEAAIDRLESDPNLWVGVLAGSPPVFSAGADLKEIRLGGRELLRTQRGGFAGLTTREREKPLIVAVEGAALAGGMEMCLACDLIVAAEDARFGIPEVRRSLVAAAGGLFRLPRAVPYNLAMEMAITGEPIAARRAFDLGLVNRITPSGGALDGAVEMARLIELNAPGAVRSSRRVIRAVASGNDDRGQLSAEAMDQAMASADAAEGLAAFAEKRPPRWTGA